MSAECRKCGRDLDGDFKCGTCECEAKLEIAIKALTEIRNEKKSFGACPGIAKRALDLCAKDSSIGVEKYYDGCMRHMWTPGDGGCPMCADENESEEMK